MMAQCPVVLDCCWKLPRTTGAAEAAGAGAGVGSACLTGAEGLADTCSIIGLVYATFADLVRVWRGVRKITW